MTETTLCGSCGAYWDCGCVDEWWDNPIEVAKPIDQQAPTPQWVKDADRHRLYSNLRAWSPTPPDMKAYSDGPTIGYMKRVEADGT